MTTVARLVIAAALGLSAWPAFSADAPAARSVFVMNVDGSQARRVVQIDAFQSLGAPRWSHDGKRLAFEAYGRGQVPRCLYVDVTGKNLIDMGAGSQPDWSPDDKQLAFTIENVGASSIWVQNVDGRGTNWLCKGRGARWSPDGSRLALFEPPRILDLIAQVEGDVYTPNDKVDATLGCAWSSDGKRMAAVIERAEKREVLLIELTTPARVRTRYRGALHPTLDFSPDGKKLAVSIRGDKTDDHQVHLLDVEGDAAPIAIPAQVGDNREPAFSPDGTQLALASSRATDTAASRVVLPPVATLEPVSHHNKGGTVYSLAFVPGGTWALLGGDRADPKMQLWNWHNHRVERTFNVPGVFVAVSPDGLHAASARFNAEEIDYIELATGTFLQQFKPGGQILSLEFSADGSKLLAASENQTISVMDVATGEELQQIQLRRDVRQAAFSPDGSRIAAAYSDQLVRVWDTDSGTLIREMKHPAPVWCVAYSPNGRYLLSGTGGKMTPPWREMDITPLTDNRVRVWDVESGKLLGEMPGHKQSVCSVAWAPDNRLAVSAGHDRTVRLWDVEQAKELSHVTLKAWATSAKFSFDGAMVLVSGGAERDLEGKRWFESTEDRVRLLRVERP